MSDFTQLLRAAGRGEVSASELLPYVYEELRRLAASRLAQENPGQTLQPTALVHEAYLRLLGKDASSAEKSVERPQWEGRGHFLAAAAEAMRRILIENARRKKRQRHGGGRQRVDLAGQDLAVERPPEELLAIDEALTRLTDEDADAAAVVKLHFYAGLSIEEAAAALEISRASAYRHWSYARAWLRAALSDEGPPNT